MKGASWKRDKASTEISVGPAWEKLGGEFTVLKASVSDR